MRDSYDLFNGGIPLLIADLKRLNDNIIRANKTAIRTLEPMMLERVRFYGSLNNNEENRNAVLNNNKFDFKGSSKWTSKIRLVNTDVQSTYAEYGYGLIGANSPIQPEQEVFGDVGWLGYDLPSEWKMKMDNGEQYWWHKNVATQGEPSTPTYYRTYLYIKQNLRDHMINTINAIIK